jgi:hypothetical protein
MLMMMKRTNGMGLKYFIKWQKYPVDALQKCRIIIKIWAIGVNGGGNTGVDLYSKTWP